MEKIIDVEKKVNLGEFGEFELHPLDKAVLRCLMDHLGPYIINSPDNENTPFKWSEKDVETTIMRSYHRAIQDELEMHLTCERVAFKS